MEVVTVLLSKLFILGLLVITISKPSLASSDRISPVSEDVSGHVWWHNSPDPVAYRAARRSKAGDMGAHEVPVSRGAALRVETAGEYECPSTYRPNPDGDRSTFQMFDAGHWWTQHCQSGLVWDQVRCRCDYPPGTPWQLDCRNYRSAQHPADPGRYEQFVNGDWLSRDCSPAADLVWDQDRCQCVWGPNSQDGSSGAASPCDIMLNMTFENGVKDEAKGSYVEVGQGLPLPIRNDPEAGPVRGGNRAAYFTDTALNLWYFSDNDMGASLRLDFRFRHERAPRSRSGISGLARDSVYQILMSNGCNVSASGYTAPSLAIGYRASDGSYLLAFETTSTRRAIVCSHSSGSGYWHRVSLVYENGTLVMRVDDQPCVFSTDFFGSILKTPCPLTIGADPLDRQAVFTGYLDDLIIARGCSPTPDDETASTGQEFTYGDAGLNRPVAYRAITGSTVGQSSFDSNINVTTDRGKAVTSLVSTTRETNTTRVDNIASLDSESDPTFMDKNATSKPEDDSKDVSGTSTYNISDTQSDLPRQESNHTGSHGSNLPEVVGKTGSSENQKIEKLSTPLISSGSSSYRRVLRNPINKSNPTRSGSSKNSVSAPASTSRVRADNSGMRVVRFYSTSRESLPKRKLWYAPVAESFKASFDIPSSDSADDERPRKTQTNLNSSIRKRSKPKVVSGRGHRSKISDEKKRKDKQERKLISTRRLARRRKPVAQVRMWYGDRQHETDYQTQNTTATNQGSPYEAMYGNRRNKRDVVGDYLRGKTMSGDKRRYTQSRSTHQGFTIGSGAIGVDEFYRLKHNKTLGMGSGRSSTNLIAGTAERDNKNSQKHEDMEKPSRGGRSSDSDTEVFNDEQVSAQRTNQTPFSAGEIRQKKTLSYQSRESNKYSGVVRHIVDNGRNLRGGKRAPLMWGGDPPGQHN